MITDIRVFLEDYKGREIIYIPNVGNAGDSLIAYATIKIFDELGLYYKIGNGRGGAKKSPYAQRFENSLLFYGGGGNLIGDYRACREFLKNNKDGNEIVILPHTIKDEDALLSSCGDNITFICREQKSYNYVNDLGCKTLLSHDMALWIDEELPAPTKGVLNAFRIDDEKTNINLPDDNIDLSLVLRKFDWDKDTMIDVGWRFINEACSYEIINTNRLHVAIAGILGYRQINFYPNSYYKNFEVYNNSMKDRKNVKWCG